MDGKRAGRLLLVEDEHLLRGLIAQFLRGEGFEVIEAEDGLQGASFFSGRGPFDLVLLDMNMPRMSGLELLAEMCRLGIQTPVLMLTGNEDNRTAADALAGGILAYIPKPFELQHLELLVSLAASPRTTTAAA